MPDVIKSVLIKLIMEALEKLITPSVIKEAKVAAVKYLAELAKSTDNEIDDKIVEIVAKALEVDVPA